MKYEYDNTDAVKQSTQIETCSIAMLFMD